MANKIYLSDLMVNGGAVSHSVYAGQKVERTASVLIPAGTLLVTTDKILIARFPTGTIFNQIIVQFPDLEASTTDLTLHVGYDRPVVNPALPYNATTNPYITGAIATADTDFFEASATTGQAGGVLNLLAAGFTVTSSPASAGFVDVSITPAVLAGSASAAAGQINFYVEALIASENQTMTAISGADSYDYTTNYDI